VSGASKFYDIGNFQMAVLGGSDTTSIIGELFVEYQFDMIHPKQQTPLAQNVPFAHIAENPAGTASAAAPFGTGGGIVRSGATIPTVTGNTTFTIPYQGVFLVSACWFSTVVGSGATLTPGGNITSAPPILNGSTTASEIATATGGNSMYLGLFTVSQAGTGAANTITVSGLASLSANKADLFITQVSSAITISESVKSQASENVELESRLLNLERMLFKVLGGCDQSDKKGQEEDSCPPCNFGLSPGAYPETGSFPGGSPVLLRAGPPGFESNKPRNGTFRSMLGV